MAERAMGGVKMAYTTCRDELLKTVRTLVKDKGKNEFTPIEAITLMVQNGSNYNTRTIRTHIVSKCCINAKQNHVEVFNDYRRLERGKYELVNFK
jgi:hypothetical protein